MVRGWRERGGFGGRARWVRLGDRWKCGKASKRSWMVGEGREVM